MKITIYELLGMVKDGKAPKKIKMRDYIYEYQGDDYMCELNDKEYWLFSDGYTKFNEWLENFLNMEIEILEEEKKILEKLEDISEIKCVGCQVEINIVGNKTLFDTDTPIVTEHCIYKINQLIKNQKKIIDYLKSKGE